MGRTTWTTMHIGGALAADKIEEFLEVISNDFSYEAQEKPEDEDDIRATVASGESLVLQAHVSGQPDSVTAFCRENGLPYWVHYDAGYEWDSYIVIWQPGENAKEDECAASAQGYTPQVDLSKLREWAKRGLTLQRLIDEVARFESHKVPPLTITEPASDETEMAHG